MRFLESVYGPLNPSSISLTRVMATAGSGFDHLASCTAKKVLGEHEGLVTVDIMNASNPQVGCLVELN
jgi:hypothetical protein